MDIIQSWLIFGWVLIGLAWTLTAIGWCLGSKAPRSVWLRRTLPPCGLVFGFVLFNTVTNMYESRHYVDAFDPEPAFVTVSAWVLGVFFPPIVCYILYRLTRPAASCS